MEKDQRKRDSNAPVGGIGRRIAVVYRKISELKLNARNPRLHPRKQVKQIARSIEQFDFNSPVLVDRYLNVIAGHGRILACMELGRTEIATICLDHLSPEQAKAYMLAENRLCENSMWDDRLLAEHFKELTEIDLDFDLEVTGFDTAEIDLRIQGLTLESEEEDPADSIPDSRNAPVVTRPGDRWRLGEHIVLCASAIEDASYVALMQKHTAAMVVSDPPYNLPIEGHVSGLGKLTHCDFIMASGEMTQAEFISFLTQACTLFARHSTDSSLHYIFIDWRHVGELLAAGKIAYDELKQLCVWVKSNAGMGSFYRSQHELILVFKHGHGTHRNNIQLGKYGRNRSNVFSYPSINSFGRAGEEGNLLALHPTVKPVALVADVILDCSMRGDIVLDGFLGSGTTVIAAERTGRRCYGLELDPKYVDTIIRRYQAFTGDDARHCASGRTFNELAEELEKSDAQ
jgi:DNA modification methylase